MVPLGDSAELFKTGTDAPAEVIHGIYDPIVCAPSETATSVISELKYLHAPNYKMEIVKGMVTHEDMKIYLDVGRRQTFIYVENLVEN